MRRWLPQALVLAAFGLGIAWLADNLLDNLARRGIAVGFDFLARAARFPIAESIVPYMPTDSFGWAFVVGLGNTLFISAIVIVLSTALGLLLALARRARHPLANMPASALVEVIRNTPLVVQLLFWYGAVTIGLPTSRAALSPLPGVYVTDRGLYVPAIGIDGPGWILLVIVAVGITLMIIRRRAFAPILGATLVACAVAWALAGLSLTIERPELGRFNFMGGLTLTPEFVAVVAGLTIYSSAFAGEIIRGGIDAVARGQWEAGRAVGLSEHQTLRLIIVPQALRVIIPPMTSQYINIIKNSTLALVVGYPELNFVTATTINQTGQAVEGIVILMAVFLAISGAASLFMNWYNRRVAVVER